MKNVERRFGKGGKWIEKYDVVRGDGGEGKKEADTTFCRSLFESCEMGDNDVVL